MGCILTKESKKSKEMDQSLKKENQVSNKNTKLLLLGPGESGKSTIFKQMKIIQNEGEGFTVEERLEYRYLIHGNCVSQMKVLVTTAMSHNFKPSIVGNEARFEKFSKISASGSSWSLEIVEDIYMLWTDEAIQKAFKMRDPQYPVNDNASYFFNHIHRYAVSSYVPTHEDILRSRVRTTGIQEASFKFNDIEFKMFDVGGQKSERRKWMHLFESVTAVIFCVAISEYDQFLREDESQNRMKDSLALFEETVNSSWFENTAFIIFFNKIDLFKEKITYSNLADVFPAYQGGLNNFEESTAFIKKMYLHQVQSPAKRQQIFSHQTCAIDTTNIQFVFKAVRETLLKNTIDSIIQY